MVSVQVRGRHTVWVKKHEWARPVPVRYAMSGESLVAFGDDGLADLVAGDRAMAAVHDIAGGQVLDSFSITVTDVPTAAVDREALLDLLAHVPLGRNLAEVNARVDELSRTRRIIALVP